MKTMKISIMEYIRIPFQKGRLYASLIILHRVINGILPNIQVVIIANFIDEIIQNTKEKQVACNIYVNLVFLIVVIGYRWFSSQISSFSEARLEYKLREELHTELIHKCAKLRYECIENKNTQDLIMRVTKEPEMEVCKGFVTIIDLFSILLRVVGLVVIITMNVWWCGLVIFLLNIPCIYLAKRNGEATYQADRDASLYIRKYQYFGDVMMGRDTADERNIFKFGKYIQGLWNEQYQVAYKKLIKAFFAYFFKTKLYEIQAVVVALFMIVLLIRPTINGEITTGMFMAIVSNIFSVISLVMMQLTQYIKELSKKREYLLDLKEFRMLKEEKSDVLALPENDFGQLEQIVFQDVSFKYPENDNYTLRNVNFTLEKGKHYAFVGENGAGKTTVTKLLTGLYCEYEGNIFINGIELREYKLTKLKALTSVVYQDFAKYSIRIFDNIALGDACHFQGDSIHEKVESIVKELKLDSFINKMPNQDQTVLGKLNGEDVELSLGQWQKIAIARALIKNAPLHILDEPTASLDPFSERDIYNEYKSFSRGKTTILISHRLGSIKLAEHILVFDCGKVVESGSFETLMKKKGKFKKMYENQRSWYV